MFVNIYFTAPVQADDGTVGKLCLHGLKKRIEKILLYVCEKCGIVLSEKESTHSKVDAPKQAYVLTDTAYPVSQTG